MSPQSQAEQQINNDYNKFVNEVYKGTVAVPSNVLVLFRNGVLALAPQFHKFLANRIKVIASKKHNELTIDDLNCVITIIVNTPLQYLYKDEYTFDEIINKHILFEKFLISYNDTINKFQEDLKQKKVTLLSLAGAKNNGLKIIN